MAGCWCEIEELVEPETQTLRPRLHEWEEERFGRARRREIQSYCTWVIVYCKLEPTRV